MLNKQFTSKAAFSTAAEAAKVATTAEKQDLLAASRIDASNLPRAPQSAFRKRPVRLTYDKNEFYAFRLPTENYFLMQNFDSSAIFGKRHGLDHSPHIRDQINIDSRILLGLVGVSLLMVFSDFSRQGKFCNLRENYRRVTYGRFEADDFVKKQ